MNLNRCFEILEISPDATYEEAKAAYRLMSQVWHPDKHAHSEQLHAKATNKIKEINAAWSQIEDYFKNGASREAEAKAKEAERRANEEHERSKRAEQERQRKESSERAERAKASEAKTENPTHNLTYYRAAIGKNFEKYVDVIKLVQDNDYNPRSWHWPAFFAGITWALYRKMYKVCFAYFFITMLTNIVFMGILKINVTAMIISIGVQVAFAMYAKALYAKHIKQKISLNSQLRPAELIRKLEAEGGTNAWVVYVCVAMPLFLGILAAIAIPQYSAYREKAFASSMRKYGAEYEAGKAATEASAPAVVAPPGGWLDKAISDRDNGVVPAPLSGFIIEKDVVNDTRAGLMWTRNADIAGNQMAWDEAMRWVKQLNCGGYTGWSLPSKEEFEAFVKHGGSIPYAQFNNIGFNNVRSGGYWSRSANAIRTNDIWYVNMEDGVAYSTSKFSLNHVWAVGRR